MYEILGKISWKADGSWQVEGELERLDESLGETDLEVVMLEHGEPGKLKSGVDKLVSLSKSICEAPSTVVSTQFGMGGMKEPRGFLSVDVSVQGFSIGSLVSDCMVILMSPISVEKRSGFANSDNASSEIGSIFIWSSKDVDIFKIASTSVSRALPETKSSMAPLGLTAFMYWSSQSNEERSVL